MTTLSNKPLNPDEIIAVFDESGSSNLPGPSSGDDFSLGAVVAQSPDAIARILEADRLIQAATRTDYKYKHVRNSVRARHILVSALNDCRDALFVFAYYASGGAFLQQAQREFHAVTAYGGDVLRAMQNLQAAQDNPRHSGLSDAIQTSLSAISAWAHAQRKRAAVYFDRRSDLATIESIVIDHLAHTNKTGLWGDAYKWMDWRGEAPRSLLPMARVADIIAGDIRATMRKHGHHVFEKVQQHGFVGMHEQVSGSQDAIHSPVAPMPRIGFVSQSVWDADWEGNNPESTLFMGYVDSTLNGLISLYSPCGRGVLLQRRDGGHSAFQLMD